MTDVSEALKLSRLFWWTSEYGLIGDVNDPKIYGAGLLSSVGEGKHALSDKVKKIPFSLEAAETNFDITEMQPQLFVIKDFVSLNETLKEFIEGMAFRRGGLSALEQARDANYYTTTELDSGLQISSIVDEILTDKLGKPCFIRYRGGTQLAYEYRQLEGQGVDHHTHGFSTPIGKVKGKGKSPSALNEGDLTAMGFYLGGRSSLEFTSGIVVEGVLKNTIERDGKRLVMTFDDCTVTWGDKVLFKPEWSPFDMACGEKVVSVYGGAADKLNFPAFSGDFKQRSIEQKTNLTERNRALNELYGRVREIREAGGFSEETIEELSGIKERLDTQYPMDWLLRYELLEFQHDFGLDLQWTDELRSRLDLLKNEVSEEEAKLIERGLELFEAREQAVA
jgi:phenylalanine-4-hydroxylase